MILKMEDLEALAAGYPAGQGSAYRTSQDRNRLKTLGTLPVFAPRIQERVYSVVAGAGQTVTRQEIARALGLKKTPWLVDVIEGLVDRGYLVRHEGRWPNGLPYYGYEVRR